MPNQNSQLLTPIELLDIYGIPIINEIELREYFTFNKNEIIALKKHKDPADAIYFATCLVFFKLKHTLINFGYQNITQERRHIMERYFPRKKSPRSLPQDRYRIIRLENQALKLYGYQRYGDELCTKLNLKKELAKLAASHPRQRQLCKAFLDLLIKNRVAIPGYTTVQDVVSETWNIENNRIVKTYIRNTSNSQRDVIGFLLIKAEHHHNIISIKQDMKGFNTHELLYEIQKHDKLKPIFEIAKITLPKLQLPMATIDYYASLVNYYTGARLKTIDPYLAQFYLLCYSYTRYQALNDNLLEALKKRTLEYDSKAKDYADEQATKQVAKSEDVRRRVSNMLIAIKQHPDKQNVPRDELYKHVPEDDLLMAAKMLVDDNFDSKILFWKYIDSVETSIKLNLRKIFLTLDLVVVNNNVLASVISYIKDSIRNDTFYDTPLPHHVRSWIPDKHQEYLFYSNKAVHNRLEFLLYQQIVHHISTNKL